MIGALLGSEEVSEEEDLNMPNDPGYDAILSIAGDHLREAYDRFHEDPRVPWRGLSGNVSKVRAQVWVDALKEALAHHEQIERTLS